MHALREGSGDPLVLVHGLGSSGETFRSIIPGLTPHRTVVAPDLPGFGASPALPGEASVAGLTDALQGWLHEEDLDDADLVGSSLGGRMVLELARRGVGRGVVALDPGGFWSDRELTYFRVTLGPSLRLVKRLQPVMPALTSNSAGRVALLSQLSAAPAQLSAETALREMRAVGCSPATGPVYDALVRSPRQLGMRAGAARGPQAIGWGRKDRLTLPSQAARAAALFPDATVHWFDESGHFPHLDRPEDTVRLILDTLRR